MPPPAVTGPGRRGGTNLNFWATQRLSAGRARDHPVMEIVPNKALSLSLSLHWQEAWSESFKFGLRPGLELQVELQVEARA